MLVADVDDLLTCFRSFEPELLFQDRSFLGVAYVLDLEFTVVLLPLLFLKHEEQLVVESLPEKVHVFLSLQDVVAWPHH